jgi:single-strand DNA-binding protein
MSVNKIHIIGNMGRDPEMKYSSSGQEVTTVSVAQNDRNEKTNWFTVVAFRKTAEFLNNFGIKGRKVYIEGRMQQNRWEDSEGQTRTTWELVASHVEFLDSRNTDLREPDDL